MAFEVWFKEDIRRVIRALLVTAQKFGGEYQQGYIDALLAIGLLFGIDEQEGEVVNEQDD